MNKLIIYAVAVILTTGVTSALDVNSSQNLNYYNDGTLQFQVDTSGNIQSYGNLDMNSNSITNFFGSACPSGQTVVDVNDDGSFQCMDVSSEVSSDYVNRNGDTMTGDLDILKSSSIIGLGAGGNAGPHGLDLYDSDDTIGMSLYYRTSPQEFYVEDSGGTKLVEVDKSGNLDIGGSLTSGTVPTARLDNDAVTINSGSYLTGGGSVPLGGSTSLSVDPSGINWGDTSMSRSDVSVSNLGAADSNLNMNGNSIDNAGTIVSEGETVQESTPSRTLSPGQWYTIANNTGDRASAKFVVTDRQGGEHTTVHFYAAHHYGQDNSNVINVISDSDYGGGCVDRIRIKEAGTYDGANLQIYLGGNSGNDCSGVQAFMTENFQDSGWVLKDWIVGGDSYLSEETRVDLTQGRDNVARFTNGIRTKGQIDTSAGAMRLPTGTDSW